MWSQLGDPDGLVPDLQETVPRPSCHSHSILGNAQTADTIVMPSKNTCSKHQPSEQWQTQEQFRKSQIFFSASDSVGRVTARQQVAANISDGSLLGTRLTSTSHRRPGWPQQTNHRPYCVMTALITWFLNICLINGYLQAFCPQRKEKHFIVYYMFGYNIWWNTDISSIYCIHSGVNFEPLLLLPILAL